MSLLLLLLLLLLLTVIIMMTMMFIHAPFIKKTIFLEKVLACTY
jgi:hypothetical protein